MIIKAKVRGGRGLADYLLKSEKNERAELLEMRGFRGTLKGALGLEEELAERATHCEKPFYHVAFRAAPGEELTPEQWRTCAARFEEKLGLENHHRALVMHTTRDGDKLQQHMHVVYSRLDPETLKAVNLFRDHYHCKAVSRELERELGLQQVRDHAPERKLEPPTRGEREQARRHGQKSQDLEQTRAAIREAWERSDDGKSFAAALKERGLELAQGERRDYVAVDGDGSVYSIGKRTTGARAADVREKLADLDRADLPTVEQAREEQRRERGDMDRAEERNKESKKERKFEPEHAAPEKESTKSIAELDAEDKAAKRARLEDFERKREEGREPERDAPTMEPTDAAPAVEIELGKGAERAATGVLGAVTRVMEGALEGVADFFVGPPPPPKEPERPRTKTIAERDAEDRAEKQAELDRRRAMTEEEREQERERRRERERQRER